MSVTHISGYSVEESLFSTLDYIPLVSTISGTVRANFGFLETFFGVIVAPIQIGQRLMSDNKSRFLFNIGLSNVVRGTVAGVPILGNAAIYFYDHLPHTKSDVQNLFGLSKFS